MTGAAHPSFDALVENRAVFVTADHILRIDRQVSLRASIHDVNFDLHCGAILGIFGTAPKALHTTSRTQQSDLATAKQAVSVGGQIDAGRQRTRTCF